MKTAFEVVERPTEVVCTMMSLSASERLGVFAPVLQTLDRPEKRGDETARILGADEPPWASFRYHSNTPPWTRAASSLWKNTPHEQKNPTRRSVMR